jgi:hypothetical protein
MTRTTDPRSAPLLGAAWLAAVGAMTAQAQDPPQRTAEEIRRAQEELDRTPTDCVLMNRVDRYQAASNGQVVFFMKAAARTT